MANYNRVQNPRAYVDQLSRYIAVGHRTAASHYLIKRINGTAITPEVAPLETLFDLRPSNFARIAKEEQQFYIDFDSGIGTDAVAEHSFLAILGHNLYSAESAGNASGCNISLKYSDTTGNSGFGGTDGLDYATVTQAAFHDKIINCASGNIEGSPADQNNYISVPSNGWTMFTWSEYEIDSLLPSYQGGNQIKRLEFRPWHTNASTNFDNDIDIGCILMGKVVDLGSPNMRVKFEVDYDGNKLINSVGGHTFSNSQSFGPPPWAAHDAWVNATEDTHAYKWSRHQGRRKWSLKFDFVPDTNMFLSNMNTNHGGMADGTDLYSQFYHNIIGSHLPFIFSADRDSTISGDYGLYRLADGKMRTEQVAHRFWSSKINLVESW